MEVLLIYLFNVHVPCKLTVLAHDPNTSMKQALNSYMSFPEDKEAPSTSLSESNRLSDFSFAQLLALADVAWAHSNALLPGSNDGLRNPSVLTLKPQFMGHQHLSLEQRSIIHDNSQDPQGTSSTACCRKTTSQVAPPIPDNGIRVERRKLSAMLINIEEKDQGEEEKIVPAKKPDNNVTPHNKEGKPKRTQKPVSPKPVQSKENRTGKRKYVRRKALNKNSTPPTEVTGELTKAMMTESAKKSCRKSLNVDIGARDESSAGRGNANVHLGKEIGVAAVETHVALAYDLNTSMKQASNNYMSLPDKTRAPSTSPSKRNPPGAKPQENPIGKKKYVKRKD